jgi:hypothetical protein
MPRDIVPLTRALDDATLGNQTDVYGLLAAWNQSSRLPSTAGAGVDFRRS